MINERKAKLLETMKKINKDQGNFMDFAKSVPDSAFIKTGIPIIDTFVGGGFKKGNFTIAWGSTGCGKSTLCLQTIANAQKEGQLCVYIDMERSFEKERAIQLGVNLEELVLVNNCQTAEDAMGVVRTLAKDKVCDLVIVDSIQAMSPKGEQENKGKERDIAENEMALLAQKLSKFFRIVSPDVFRAKITCILIGQCRMSLGSFIVKADLSGGEALKHWAYQTIFMRRGQGADAPNQVETIYFLDGDGKVHKRSEKIPCGFDAVLKLTKTKSSNSALELSEIHVPFVYDKGFVQEVIQAEDKIVLEGTEEEKEKIRAYLIEKGIIQQSKINNSFDFLNKEEEDIYTEKDGTPIETSKKRGRPKKEKK